MLEPQQIAEPIAIAVLKLGIWGLGLFDDEDLDEALEDELVDERDGDLGTGAEAERRTPRSGDIEGDEGERYR